MANNPIGMREVRELLRLYFKQGLSGRKAAQAAGVGKTAASQYITGFKNSRIPYAAIPEMSDSELIALINIMKKTHNSTHVVEVMLFRYVEMVIKRVDVTLQLLWDEYRETHKDCYEFCQVCYHYHYCRKSSKLSMHMDHK